MNWLSQKEIKRRAKISDEEALNVSIEHWEQICEVIRAGEYANGNHRGDDCGLCQRYHTAFGGDGCRKCCLSRKIPKNCCEEWESFHDDQTLANAQAMLNRLYLERGKVYGQPKKECKKEKPKELRHGDYRVSKHKEIQFFVKDDSNNTMRLCQGNYMFRGTIDEWGIIEDPIDSGNFVDDLERNSKDLEKFERPSFINNPFIASIVGSCIEFRLPEGYCAFNIEEIVKIHQKLGQLISTAKRKAEKDC